MLNNFNWIDVLSGKEGREKNEIFSITKMYKLNR
jgi:hypothetical protein